VQVDQPDLYLGGTSSSIGCFMGYPDWGFLWF